MVVDVLIDDRTKLRYQLKLKPNAVLHIVVWEDQPIRIIECA
jgi:hypothetical protein